jgi:hypothetical protein
MRLSVKRFTLLASLALVFLVVVGCTNWETTTYQSLAASQTTLNNAQAAYEVSKVSPCPTPANPSVPCIPHTAAAYKAITDGKVIWKSAADAMIAYETVKAANAAPDVQTKAQNDVEAAILNVGPIVKDINALYSMTGGK